MKVTAGELTCLGCGETFQPGKRCYRCGSDEKGKAKRVHLLPPAVPTVSYLKNDEWERA